MNNRLVGWFTASLIAVAVISVALVGVLRNSGESADTQEAPITSPDERVGDTPAALIQSDESSDGHVDARQSLLSDLGYHCPSIHGELTEDCLHALDRSFGAELTQDAPLVPVCDQPTWSQVFDDPVGKREDVISALSREECRSESDEIRSNTGCARNAIAELSVLYLQCTERNEYRDGVEFTAPVLTELLDRIGSVDSEEYHVQRQSLQADYYRERWVAERCRRLDHRAFAPIDELEGIYTGVFGNVIKIQRLGVEVRPQKPAGGPIWEENVRSGTRDRGFTLRAAAARLGHLWALSEYPEYDLLLTDIFSLNPAQALIYRGRLQADAIHPLLVPFDIHEERKQRWKSLWEKLEAISPGIRAQFELSDSANLTFSTQHSQAMDRWWGAQEPAVREAYEEYRTGGIFELREESEAAKESFQIPYIHAALMHLQRQNIQHSDDAIPKWAVDISEEESKKAQEILQWMDETHPNAVHAPDPSADETCDAHLRTPESESAVEETDFDRISE